MLTLVQCNLLKLVNNNSCANDICKKTGMTYAAVKNNISYMMDAGLLTRDKKDGRKFSLLLTDSGKLIQDKIYEIEHILSEINKNKY